MKTLIFALTTLFVFGLNAQAANKALNCEINLEAKSTNGYGTVLMNTYPVVTTFSALECFNKATEIAGQMTMSESEGELVDASVFKTRGNKISWRKVISWSVDDRAILNSSGIVTPYSVYCMHQSKDARITGEKLFWRGCEAF